MKIKEILNDFKGKIKRGKKNVQGILMDEFNFKAGNTNVELIIGSTYSSRVQIRWMLRLNLNDKFLDGIGSDLPFEYSSLEFTGNGSTDIIDSGDQFIVFSGIKKCLETYYEENHPTVFTFVAEQTSRIKLYNLFTKLIMKQWGFVVDTFDQVIEGVPRRAYVLYKPGKIKFKGN